MLTWQFKIVRYYGCQFILGFFFRDFFNGLTNASLRLFNSISFQAYLAWKWWVGGVVMSSVALIGLAANSMSMAVLRRPKLRAIAFNQLLFILCIVDTTFLLCNSLSCLHALGVNSCEYNYEMLYKYLLCHLSLWYLHYQSSLGISKPHFFCFMHKMNLLSSTGFIYIVCLAHVAAAAQC